MDIQGSAAHILSGFYTTVLTFVFFLHKPTTDHIIITCTGRSLVTIMATLTKDTLASSSDPFIQFQAWHQEVAQAEPNQAEFMCLSTCGKTGRPTSRMVNLAKFDEQGLVFYTDRGSRKVVDLEENKYVSVLFYWTLPTTSRQVRVTGKVEQLPRDEVVAFIRQVPKPCYLKALAINQDEVLADRIELEQKYHEVEKKYASTPSQDLPIPDWVGYRILPNSF